MAGNMTPQQGDVILYPAATKSFISRLIGAAQMLLGLGHSLEAYSHAAILDTDGFDYEAKWPKTGRFKIDTSRVYEVWSIGNLTSEQRLRVIAWARANQGQWYNMIGLLTGGLLGLKHTEVCSQFVGLAYASAGINISKEGARLLSPDAIPDYPGAVMVARYQIGELVPNA